MEILVKSSIDGSMQPSLFYKASKPNRPLLVGLHTWSFDRSNQISNMLPCAQQYDFNLLLPEFRGANLKNNPNLTEACGSELAKADIKDAIEYVIAEANDHTDNKGSGKANTGCHRTCEMEAVDDAGGHGFHQGYGGSECRKENQHKEHRAYDVPQHGSHIVEHLREGNEHQSGAFAKPFDARIADDRRNDHKAGKKRNAHIEKFDLVGR